MRSRSSLLTTYINTATALHDIVYFLDYILVIGGWVDENILVISLESQSGAFRMATADISKIASKALILSILQTDLSAKYMKRVFEIYMTCYLS